MSLLMSSSVRHTLKAGHLLPTCMNLPLPLSVLPSALSSVQTTPPASPPPASRSQHVLFPALPAVETSTEVFVCVILFVIHKVFAKLFFISVPLFVCMEYPLQSL